MSQVDKEIAELIDEIANKRHGKLRHAVMSGDVISVDQDKMTAKVRLNTDDEDVPTEGINLNVKLSNTLGLQMVPKNNAKCLVCEVDGPDKWELIKASEYVKVIATVGTSELTITSAGIKIEHGGLDFKTVMDTFFDNIQAMTFANGAGTTGPPNNLANLIIDKTNFDSIFA